MATTIGSFDLASLKNLRDDVTQYFWFESNSSSAWGSGAHVTLYPESQFTDSTNPNYMKGQNIIMNTDGFSIRNGGLPMMVLDNDSLDFNAIDTSLGTYTTIANFGVSGVNIGLYADIGDTKVVITSGGFDLKKATGKSGHTIVSEKTVAHLGDDYATIGSRAIGSTIGDQSVVIGTLCEASGYRSIAEGSGTVASDEVAHAEGANSVASEYASHAEGQSTTASGPEAHAEGNHTLASGYESHAQNGGTIAQGYRQTAIGSYNIAQGGRAEIQNTDYAFIIGNGTDDDARSNALTVDWNGDIFMALNTTAASGTTDGDLYAAITALGWQNDVIV